jgi:hypothetical protein
MAKQRPGKGGKGSGGGGGKRGAKSGGGSSGGGKGWSDRAASDARVKKMERYEDTLEDGGVDDCEWCGLRIACCACFPCFPFPYEARAKHRRRPLSRVGRISPASASASAAMPGGGTTSRSEVLGWPLASNWCGSGIGLSLSLEIVLRPGT